MIAIVKDSAGNYQNHAIPADVVKQIEKENLPTILAGERMGNIARDWLKASGIKGEFIGLMED